MKPLKEGLLCLVLLAFVSMAQACSSVSQIQVTEFGGDAYVKGVDGNGQPVELRVESTNITDADGITPCVTLLLRNGAVQSKGTYESAPKKCVVKFGVFGQFEMVLPSEDKGEVLDPNS